MPFAKQELVGENTRKKTTKFFSENSAIDVSSRGVTYLVGDKRFVSEDLMDKVLKMLGDILLQDIIKELPLNRHKDI